MYASHLGSVIFAVNTYAMKIIYTLLALFLSVTVNAQFVELSGPVDTMIVNIADPAETAHLYWNVVNVSGATKMVGCSREMILAVPGTEHQFCWDIICYPYSNISESTPVSDFVTISNGDSVQFAASYRHFGIAGMSVVKHCWYTTSGDSLCFETRYCSDATCSVMASSDELATSQAMFRVTPNPIASTGMLYLPKPASNGSRLELHNSMGQCVRIFSVPTGSSIMMFGVDDLPQGTYVLSQINPNGERSSQRIVVSH